MLNISGYNIRNFQVSHVDAYKDLGITQWS